MRVAVFAILPLALAACTTGGAPQQSQGQRIIYPGGEQFAPEPYYATNGSWRLIVDDRQMALTRMDAFRTSQSTPFLNPMPTGYVYDGQRFAVAMERRPCRLEGSDKVYPDRVTIDVGRDQLIGCGGPASLFDVRPLAQRPERPEPDRYPQTASVRFEPFGEAFRGGGTEPFWGIEVDQRIMTFDRVDGGDISENTPSVVETFDGWRFEGRDIRVEIVPGLCSDGMSDRDYPYHVDVAADGRDWTGCGAPASYYVDGWESGPSLVDRR
ncbi:hypothetical protein [Sphingomicrobium sediminis]|uniref:Lipoprotein n=1 Tax=Sphingomicrobium sediminis TaxID=2950949 RepID=A0A9X2J1R1_9SPHN|nr:hypothetical protein [Sphingomicrobium sediminis]MCM8556989.1 hypothetical protein [Sphingomicrobium sediminis]